MRVQLRLAGTAERLFSSIVTKLGVQPKDVVLDALGLLHFAVEEVGEGRKIGSYDPATGQFSAWTTPTLEAWKATSRQAMAEPRAAAQAR
jgi:hypothetical protein